VFDRRSIAERVFDGVTVVVGRRDDDLRIAVVESVGNSVRSEALVDAAPDGTSLERPDQRHVVFLNPWHVREHTIALFHAEFLEDVRELARAIGQLPEGHLREFSVGVDLIERDLLALAGVSVGDLMCDVEFSWCVPVGFRINVSPRERLPFGLVVGQIVAGHHTRPRIPFPDITVLVNSATKMDTCFIQLTTMIEELYCSRIA